MSKTGLIDAAVNDVSNGTRIILRSRRPCGARDPDLVRTTFSTHNKPNAELWGEFTIGDGIDTG